MFLKGTRVGRIWDGFFWGNAEPGWAGRRLGGILTDFFGWMGEGCPLAGR